MKISNYHLLIFDFFYLSFLILILIFSSPSMVGGGWAYYFSAGIVIGFSKFYYKDKFKKFSLSFSIFLFSLVIINYIAQYEKMHGFSELIIIVDLLLIMIIWLSLLNALYLPIDFKYEENVNKRYVKKYILFKVIHGIFISIILFILIAGFLILCLMDNNLPVVIVNKQIGLTYFLPFCFFIGSLYSYIQLKTIPATYYNFLLKENIQEDLAKISFKKISYLFLFIFFFGLLSEILRKNYIIFIFTYLILFSGLILIFNFWNKFKKGQKIDNVEFKIEDISNAKFLIKQISIMAIVFILSIFTFLLFLIITNKFL